MKTKQLLSESMLRSQIAVGGIDGWSLEMGKYRIVLLYDEEFRTGLFARLRSPIRRLVTVVYDTGFRPDAAILQISIPAKAASVSIKHDSHMQVWGTDGHLCAFEISACNGFRFIGGKWGRISAEQTPGNTELHRGVTTDTERWRSVNY